MATQSEKLIWFSVKFAQNSIISGQILTNFDKKQIKVFVIILWAFKIIAKNC